MKILNLKFKEHPVLGNLELDLTNNGKPAKSIIIAGDNGTGKTTLLKLLKFNRIELNSIHSEIIFTIKFSNFELELIKNSINYKNIDISNTLKIF
jgi:ABC-type molybdenum transport system ATPase subunit/photorepair protein PhrA